MRWRYVFVAGLILAAALYVGSVRATPVAHEGPAPAEPYYLLWASICMVGLAAAGAVLTFGLETRPRVRATIAQGLVGVACALAMFGLGEAAVYMGDQPPPGRTTAEDHAALVFFAGTGVIAAACIAGLVAINRLRRDTAQPDRLRH